MYPSEALAAEGYVRFSGEAQARVIHVVDGDALEVQLIETGEFALIALAGIDTGGRREAADFLSGAILGRTVDLVESTATPNDSRFDARWSTAYLTFERILYNRSLLQRGLALVDSGYAGHLMYNTFIEDVFQAQEARAGIWGNPSSNSPTSPNPSNSPNSPNSPNPSNSPNSPSSNPGPYRSDGWIWDGHRWVWDGRFDRWSPGPGRGFDDRWWGDQRIGDWRWDPRNWDRWGWGWGWDDWHLQRRAWEDRRWDGRWYWDGRWWDESNWWDSRRWDDQWRYWGTWGRDPWGPWGRW